MSVLVLRVACCFAQAREPVELTWEAPESCPQQPEVAREIRTLLGTASSDQKHPLRAHGTIEPLGESYRLTLEIGRATKYGTRVIESDDCSSLGKAAAVVLGLLVQKERALGRDLSESDIGRSTGLPENGKGQGEQPARCRR